MKILTNFFHKKSLKIELLYEYINMASKDMDKRNDVISKKDVSVNDLSKWYSEKIKEYEHIIDEAEQEIGLKNVCEKGCSACCKQAIYINPFEYRIIERYVNQMGYVEKENLTKYVREALKILKETDVPMKIKNISQKEQNHISAMFFSCNIQCPFLSKDNECRIYNIRPCVCWDYRKYQDKSECQECSSPRYACAFVDLEISLIKKMYEYGKGVIKHTEHYLLVYALGIILGI